MVSFFYCRYIVQLTFTSQWQTVLRFNQQTKHFLSVNTRHSVHLKVADMEMEEILKEWQSGEFVSDPSSHACLAVKVCSLFSRSLQCKRRQLLSVNPARLIFPFSTFSTIRIIINNAHDIIIILTTKRNDLTWFESSCCQRKWNKKPFSSIVASCSRRWLCVLLNQSRHLLGNYFLCYL